MPYACKYGRFRYLLVCWSWAGCSIRDLNIGGINRAGFVVIQDYNTGVWAVHGANYL